MNRIEKLVSKYPGYEKTRKKPIGKEEQRLLDKYKRTTAPIKATNYQPMISAINKLNESIDQALIYIAK